MDIYEYAMQMEKDGEAFYRGLAEMTVNKGLSRILTKLAEAEVKHYAIFQAMRKKEDVQVADTPILKDVKNIFITMKEEKSFTVEESELELYRKAQQIEQKSMDFYLEEAGKVADAAQKQIFIKVADEEKKHFLILENMIAFVSRPVSWLENPEWYHLEEY